MKAIRSSQCVMQKVIYGMFRIEENEKFEMEKAACQSVENGKGIRT